jgi:hypothetical protein
VRFTDGEIAFRHPDASSNAPRDSNYARVLADGRLQTLTLPAALQAGGWGIQATTASDFVLTKVSQNGGDDPTVTDLARWNPLTGALTVIQHNDGGPALTGFLAWNSYFDS